MKNPIIPRLLPILLIATASAFAEPEVQKDIVIRRGPPKGEGPHHNMQIERHARGVPIEMEKVAYLGVETMPVDPTIAAQLGLPRGTGVVVRRVAEGSPAAGLLQEHDVLTKLDDQILVNMGQLSVLVRNHKIGDEVKLTYIRAGKETTAKAKLAEREVPKFAWEGGEGGPTMQFFGSHAPMGGGAMSFSSAVPAVPGHALTLPPGGEPHDVMRVINGERMNWFGAHPRVHVLRRQGGAGATILDLPAGSFVFSDEEGAVEVNATEGKRELTVKDKAGKVTFQGPINTPEEHAKLPAEVRARIEAIGGAEFGDEAEDLKVETKVIRPGAKIHFKMMEPAAETEIEPGMRVL